jgi:ubiquitin-activating enzyme E1
MRMSDLVETVTKKPLPPHTKQFLVEVVASDAEGEDVEVSRLSGF